MAPKALAVRAEADEDAANDDEEDAGAPGEEVGDAAAAVSGWKSDKKE